MWLLHVIVCKLTAFSISIFAFACFESDIFLPCDLDFKIPRVSYQWFVHAVPRGPAYRLLACLRG